MIYKAIIYKVTVFYEDTAQELDCKTLSTARAVAEQFKNRIVVISKVRRSYDTNDILNTFSEKQLAIISDTRGTDDEKN